MLDRGIGLLFVKHFYFKGGNPYEKKFIICFSPCIGDYRYSM